MLLLCDLHPRISGVLSAAPTPCRPEDVSTASSARPTPCICPAEYSRTARPGLLCMASRVRQAACTPLPDQVPLQPVCSAHRALVCMV